MRSKTRSRRFINEERNWYFPSRDCAMPARKSSRQYNCSTKASTDCCLLKLRVQIDFVARSSCGIYMKSLRTINEHREESKDCAARSGNLLKSEQGFSLFLVISISRMRRLLREVAGLLICISIVRCLLVKRSRVDSLIRFNTDISRESWLR